MAKVSVQHLQLVYAGSATNDGGVDLEIADREFVVIAGPRGCGKSSLLRAIAGLGHISKGEVFISDRRVTDLAPKERDVAIIFETAALYPRMSVHANLAFGLRRRKFSEKEAKKRIDGAAETLGITELLDRHPHELTAIQRQLVAIARAAVRQPKVVLFDEPLLGFDAASRAQMRTVIVRIREHLQATFIYATREPRDAMALADRIALMRRGVVEQFAAPAEIYDAPRNLFVAGFVGAPAMNFVNGTLRLDREGLVFSESEGGTIQLSVSRSEGSELQEFVGKPIILGIRCEDIRVSESATERREAVGEFPAIIDLVEPSGAETNLYIHTGAHALICRTSERLDEATARHRARFALNAEKVHLFDPATTLRIV